jgi:hypothetical protein
MIMEENNEDEEDEKNSPKAGPEVNDFTAKI